MQEDYFIPRFLDEPERMLVWTIPEFCWLIFCGALGFFLKQWVGALFGILIGAFSLRKLSKYSDLHGKGFLQYWCYWSLPKISGHFKAFSDSHIRRWYV